jgi:hypothetical protein
MKKILSISIISTLLFISNLSFAQNSDDTVLVQLNNLQIKEIQQNPEEGILATFIVTKASPGFKCQYFPDKESKPKPCPLKLRRNILKALRQGLKVNISEETELLDINRENITIQDFQVGDKINVYGELDRQSYEIDALIVRRIGKGKIVPPPVTKLIKVISPNGGEEWQKRTVQLIKYQDNRQFIQPTTIYYDLRLVPKSPECTGEFCSLHLPAPYVIDERVARQPGQEIVYNWEVGVVKGNREVPYIEVPDGEYKVEVCESGTKNCDISDNYFRIVLVLSKPEKKQCFIGGCSGEICSDRPGVISTCLIRPEYECYKKYGKCELQSNNQCGWTMTKELKKCLKKARKSLFIQVLSPNGGEVW